MGTAYCVYCDETCHLENDGINVMALGAVWCPETEKDRIFEELRRIKIKHGFASHWELKWNAVSPRKLDFYNDIVDYFFGNACLCFRGMVVPDKSLLDHEAYNQTHDQFYYKMYFDLLKILFEQKVSDPQGSYEIYLDIKDTQGQKKVLALQEYLCNNAHDFDKKVIRKIQQVRSHQVELVQLADFLVGALGYANRGLNTSEAKLKLLNKIRSLSGQALDRSSLYLEEKMNILIWKGKVIQTVGYEK